MPSRPEKMEKRHRARGANQCLQHGRRRIVPARSCVGVFSLRALDVFDKAPARVAHHGRQGGKRLEIAGNGRERRGARVKDDHRARAGVDRDALHARNGRNGVGNALGAGRGHRAARAPALSIADLMNESELHDKSSAKKRSVKRLRRGPSQQRVRPQPAPPPEPPARLSFSGS